MPSKGETRSRRFVVEEAVYPPLEHEVQEDAADVHEASSRVDVGWRHMSVEVFVSDVVDAEQSLLDCAAGRRRHLAAQRRAVR